MLSGSIRQLAIILSLIAATVIRWIYHLHWAGLDFWGDAYHHWLISRLTIANHWIYTDYKGLETVWLPGYHYLISVVMVSWGRFDLLPAHVANIVLGSLTCGLVTWLVNEITAQWRVGLGAGLTLALLPWHVAYSHINMPEIMAGLLLVALLLAVQRDWLIVLPWLTLISTLTRHELTLSIFVIGLWVWRQGKWAITWRLGLGSALGLVSWSGWSWYRTQDIWGWWQRSLNAVAFDAHFNDAVGVRLTDLGTLIKIANQAYPLLAILGLTALVAIIGVRFYRWRYQLPTNAWLLMVLVAVHWLILGRSLVIGYLPVADPRFTLVTIPILVSFGIILMGRIPQPIICLSLATLSGLLLLGSLIEQMPTFSEKAYIITPEKSAGEYLHSITKLEAPDTHWVDAPVAIYYSTLDPIRFLSSDILLPKAKRNPESLSQIALAAIENHNIRYVLWEPVSYTVVGNIWPQMAEGRAFNQNGYHFEPVFHYTGWELTYGAKPAILWYVQPSNDHRP